MCVTRAWCPKLCKENVLIPIMYHRLEQDKNKIRHNNKIKTAIYDKVENIDKMYTVNKNQRCIIGPNNVNSTAQNKAEKEEKIHMS